MKPTVPQSVMLAALEQAHGRLLRIADDSPLGERVLASCLTDTRLYRCVDCGSLFAIEPDGETDVYALVD